MRSSATVLMMTLLVSLPGFADEAAGVAAEAVKDEMVEAKKSKFKDAWVHPDADFTRYNQLMFAPTADWEFRDVGQGKTSRTNTYSTNSKNQYGIREEDREKFKQTVSESFLKEMQRSKKFAIVDTAGPTTILIKAAVVDIVSNVPPEYVGRSEVYLASTGEATLVLELLDSETGAVLAYVEDRRKIQPAGSSGSLNSFSMPSNSVTVWSDIKRWARSGASRLRSSLEKAQKG
ncbi:DUF3313 family protein [Candidatus Litorirhabdus singularis]|nr:DUF3313 family protein [Candidatus Litorirhabdus singularis]